jgi:hypothetical protein
MSKSRPTLPKICSLAAEILRYGWFILRSWCDRWGWERRLELSFTVLPVMNIAKEVEVVIEEI